VSRRLDRKLGLWFAAAALAAASAGCAVDASEPTETTGLHGTDLQEVRPATTTAQVGVAVTVARPNPPTPLNATSVPLAIPAQVLEAPEGPGLGNDKDDPRPHPWEPPSAGGATGGSASGSEPSTTGDSTGATTGKSSK
jgi:hypothetical protein